MLLNDRIQIPFTNTWSFTIKAGQAVFVGPRTTEGRGAFGVAVADVEPGASGLLETSGIFSFEESDVKSVKLYQQVYCAQDGGTGKAKFLLTLQDKVAYAGISLTDRATVGGPLVLAVGYNNPVYTATSGGSSSPSGGAAGVMSDSSTVVEPSSSSEPGAM